VPRWKSAAVGVRLVYANVDTERFPLAPGLCVRADRGRYVSIEETTDLTRAFGRGAIGYSPPDGTVILVGGHTGRLQANGVDVALEASSEALLLKAARALRPVG
jgi:hypothetical protein